MPEKKVHQAAERPMSEIDALEGDEFAAAMRERAAANELIAHEISNKESEKVLPGLETKVPHELEEVVESGERVTEPTKVVTPKSKPASLEQTDVVRPNDIGADAPQHPAGADAPPNPLGAEDTVDGSVTKAARGHEPMGKNDTSFSKPAPKAEPFPKR